MKLLALETSTESCSVALMIGDGLISRSEMAPRRHGQLLLPMCEAVLAEAGISRSELDVIAAGHGPGAFTGVRLAVAAGQGLALALDIPVIGISSLAALAMAAPKDDVAILAVTDARMGEVYAGAYLRGVGGELRQLSAEEVVAPDRLKLPAHETGWQVLGSGWSAYPAQLRARLGEVPTWADGDCFAQAKDVARLAMPMARRGEVMPAEALQPAYLRDNVAQTIAERQAARQKE